MKIFIPKDFMSSGGNYLFFINLQVNLNYKLLNNILKSNIKKNKNISIKMKMIIKKYKEKTNKKIILIFKIDTLLFLINDTKRIINYKLMIFITKYI